MCDPVTIATVGLQMMTTVQAHNDAKAVAQGQMKANEQTRRNSDQAYLYDIQKIDSEAVSVSREKAAQQFVQTQELNKKQAQALNLNAGNADKIIQDMAGTHDMAFLDVVRDYETDVTKLYNKEKESYSAQQRRYNSIKPVSMPSNSGMFLQLATQGVQGYQKSKGLFPTFDNTNALEGDGY
tara:strand:+ start:3710 stop:4255 length:546 start_codon:yes stop_codon:yes gene_type:complete